MHPFITFREPLPSGEIGYFILQRAWPHYVGRIVTEWQDMSPIHQSVPHYSMWVNFCGSLQGNLIPAQQNALQEVFGVLQQMGLWFYEQRIYPNPKKYAKWHFAKNSSS